MMIMWNENAPLELLKELPTVLNDANLARIQSVIDYDKFINSLEYGYDLCGSYAPFCEGCDKTQKSPCAVSYIKMKQAQGYDVHIEDEPTVQPLVEEETKTEPVVEEEPAPAETVAESVHEEAPKKKYIRIAIAKRKTNT
jgi:hypothetical protein